MGCAVLPCLERVKLGEKGSWSWVPLAVTAMVGARAGQVSQHRAPQGPQHPWHTPCRLPPHGVTSRSAQPDVISLLNLFSLQPCVNHFSHCFPPNSLWPGLLFLLLMCLERGARGPSWTQSRDRGILLQPAPETGSEPADGGSGILLSRGEVRNHRLEIKR